jgi:hypothetical protein
VDGARVSAVAPFTTSTVALPFAAAVAVIETEPSLKVWPGRSEESKKPPTPGVASSSIVCSIRELLGFQCSVTPLSTAELDSQESKTPAFSRISTS